MSVSENTLPGYLASTSADEMTIDRRKEASKLSLDRAQTIVDEFEALTQDRNAIRTIERLVRRSVERVSGGKLRILQAGLEIGIRENTPEDIRNLIEKAYAKLSEREHGIHVPNILQAKSKTLLRLGETLRDLGHKVESIVNQLLCKPGQLYKIYLPNRAIRRSVTGMCRGRTASGAPYFEFDNDDLLEKTFELGERRAIQRITTNTGRMVRDDNIIFGGNFVGYTHLGRPVFRILEPGEGTDLHEKFVTVDGDQYTFND